jgi:hypothetical protein
MVRLGGNEGNGYLRYVAKQFGFIRQTIHVKSGQGTDNLLNLIAGSAQDVKRLAISTALLPPNANELDITAFRLIPIRPWLGT